MDGVSSSQKISQSELNCPPRYAESNFSEKCIDGYEVACYTAVVQDIDDSDSEIFRVKRRSVVSSEEKDRAESNFPEKLVINESLLSTYHITFFLKFC